MPSALMPRASSTVSSTPGEVGLCLLANLSHEIRTPMTSVLGYLELLRADHGDPVTPAERAEAVDAIRRNGEQLLGILDNVLDLARLETGQMGLTPADCSPAVLVQSICDRHRHGAESMGLWLRLEGVESLPETVHADARRLTQLINNLVSDAVRASAAGGVLVRVGARPGPYDGHTLEIRVTDTGAGLSPEQIESLSAPLLRPDGSPMHRIGGAGLGLVIAKRLAQLMGGDLAVTSRPGEGTEFAVTIIAGRATEALPAAPQTDEPTAQRSHRLAGRILLVEDVLDSQRLLRHHLRSAGADVETAFDGRAAVATALARRDDGRPFDLILMDMQMPELDGWAATTQLRASGWIGPIVALTASMLSDHRDRCMAAGCDDFATKPITRDALIELCRRWVAEGQARHARAGVAQRVA